MDYGHILAKSRKDRGKTAEGETLAGHLQMVIDSFQIMFGENRQSPTRLAKQWLRFFKLKEADFEPFFTQGLLSCALHDMGKANSGFQELVRGKRGRQAIRHEHLSALIMWLPTVYGWLEKAADIKPEIVLCAVAGHHLKCSKKVFGELCEPDRRVFRVCADTVQSALLHASDICGLEAAAFDIPEIWEFGGEGGVLNPAPLRESVKKHLRGKFRRELKKKNDLKRMLMAVRSALILADSSGSAVVREGKDLKEWLSEAFGTVLDGPGIESSVIIPRQKEIEQGGKNFSWNDFQTAMDDLPERTLLISPCGSGKTLAAWRWIQHGLDERPCARVIFLYPTRATATEGFRDYVSWAPEADAGLIHGTAGYDLADMFDQPEDERSDKHFFPEERMYALGYWNRRIFSATVDQFLGFMQQVYRSVCLMPLLADSVVIFDEVHSYDKSLYSALKVFLKNFDIPALCMTASLPSMRRNELTEECGLTLFPTDLNAFKDLEVKAEMPRYRVGRIEDDYDAESIVTEALEAETPKKVLWVVNTVSRCQAIAKRLDALCYHSRFKLEDRKEKHEAVIKAFKKKNQPVVAVTTQVCEMSLDLDADILISETAPITAMIQRMGRCNRHAEPGSGRMGEVWFYPPEEQLPYSDDDMAGSEAFLEAVTDCDVTQKMLEELLETHGPSGVEVEKYAAFIENGPWAAAREYSLRDEKDFTVNAILNDDISAYFEARKNKKATDGLFVPVPKKFAETRNWRFPKVAPGSHYDPEYGFLEYPKEEIL